MALGADKNKILAMILRQGLTPAFIGVAAGLAGAFVLTRLMKSLLYGVNPGDPISFFGVAAILLMGRPPRGSHSGAACHFLRSCYGPPRRIISSYFTP